MTRLFRAVGAHPVAHPALGPAYHAAAALVANGGAALTYAGIQILEELGFEEREARRGLAHLLRSVAENVELLGLPGALTGPVVRGDAVTVGAHLSALAGLNREFAASYAAVQPLVIACAKQAGLDAKAVRALMRTLRAQRSRRRPRNQRKT
jgi:predicted short-subunit dehydrogenase-like oxidoreductase (DUF2520 family)